MRGIAGQWGLEVKINGQDLGLDTSNMQGFNIISNIHQHLPSISFGVNDKTGILVDRPFKDGDEIDVIVGLPDDLYPNRKFRILGDPNIIPNGSTNVLSLSGVLDKMGWMKKVVNKNYIGNASDVIGQIAKEAGLDIDIDPSNDMMNWLPNSTTLVQFARHLTERSFDSATSALLMATTESGKVRLKSLDRLIKGASTGSLSSFGNGIPILGWSVTPKSKVANSSQGYGTTSVGMNEDGSFFEANKILTTMMSRSSPISSFFQSAIGDMGSRINNFVPLSGNTHKMWNQAMHQNPRIKSTYAFDISVLVNTPTKLELLDTVDIEPMNLATGGRAEGIVGKYIITAMTKTIIGNAYYEKIVATSQSAGGV